MADQTLQSSLCTLPSVEEVLQALNHSDQTTAKELPHAVKVDIIRKEIDHQRSKIIKRFSQENAQLSNDKEDEEKCSQPAHNSTSSSFDAIFHSVVTQLTLQARPSLRYSTLEYNTATMKRGSRHIHCEELICALTGAEAAIAVNNNAAAVMMVLNEFAHGKQAVISRGELIEIGGSFRIPDIMNFSQAEMIEVGTTNKTHLSDYEKAISDNTALLLKVHTSNYRLVGFTESVEARELKKLAESVNRKRTHTSDVEIVSSSLDESNSSTKHPTTNEPILVYEDLGSGLFIRPPWLPQNEEPTVGEALAQGCDLVSFSGDKLLGGPQAGIIIGKKDLIARLKKNPLARALRLDKMTIAALEATLRLYLDPERAVASIPTLAMLCATPESLKTKAQHLKLLLEQSDAAKIASFEVTKEIARAGGGSLPMLDIPSYAVEVTFKNDEFPRACTQDCMEFLVHQYEKAIIGRINHHKLLFDVRTLVQEEDLDEIVAGMNDYVASIHQG